MREWFQDLGNWIEGIGEVINDSLTTAAQFILDIIITVSNTIMGFMMDVLMWIWREFIYPLFQGLADEWDSPFGELFNAIGIEDILSTDFVGQLANWGLLTTLAVSCVAFLAVVHFVKHLLKLAPLVD